MFLFLDRSPFTRLAIARLPVARSAMIRVYPRPVNGPALSIGRAKRLRYFSNVALTSTVTVLSLSGSADFETSIGLPLSSTKFKIPR